MHSFKVVASTAGSLCGRSQSQEPRLPDRRLSLVQVETLWSGHMSALSALRKAEPACVQHTCHTHHLFPPTLLAWTNMAWSR